MNQQNTRRGFTLIELLVVVLIIGILTAVAVPQYQRAVLKSRISTLLPLSKTLWQAGEVYYLTNGTYTRNVYDLDVSIPTQLTEWDPMDFPGQVWYYGQDFAIDNSNEHVILSYCPGKAQDYTQNCLPNREFSIYLNRKYVNREDAGLLGCISWTNLGKTICSSTQFNQWVKELSH